MRLHSKAFTALAFILWPLAVHAASDKPADAAALSAAICPIVYPVDQSPSDRGYRYLFYGNGFFINEQGYLITAAHVLSQLHGGQPYILLRQPAAAPRFVLATVVIVDRDHDVAILRATPNPFEGKYKVGFLPLAYDWITPGRAVLTSSVRPSKPVDAYTLDASVEDRAAGEVFNFHFSQLDKGRPETELFLFNHQVRLGQSGSPVVAADSQGVVGFVEGQWLRSSLVPLAAGTEQSTPGVGAAVPIHYAIALLQQKGIPWHSGASEPLEDPAASSEPMPLSLVAAPYPSQALFGGEVVLDVLIDTRGRAAEIKVVRGPSPFLEDVLATVRTWSFFPARLDGNPVPARIGITFQFSQSYDPPRATQAHNYERPPPSLSDRSARPVLTVEPQFPAASAGEGSVILYELVDAQGHFAADHVLRDSESFSSAAVASVHGWRFAPGTRDGSDIDSGEIVVLIFRLSGITESLPPRN